MDDTSPHPTNASQPRVCPGCGAPSRGRAAFCLRCGTRLPDPSSLYLPIGQRAMPQASAPALAPTPGSVKDTEVNEPPATGDGGTSAGIAELPPATPSSGLPLPLPTESIATPRLGSLNALAARSAIIHMDPEGRITGVNVAAARIFSIDEHEALGRPYTSVFGTSISYRLLRLFMQAGRAEDHASLQEMQVKRPDGQTLALRASITTQHDSVGTPIGFVFFAEGVDSKADQDQAADYAEADLAAPTIEPPEPSTDRSPPVAPAIRPAEVQRIITALHAEVRGYTALANTLAPAVVSSLLSRYHRAAVAALHQTGATVDASVVGTILALWNGPVPQEDHARRAIRAGLALQAAVGEVGSELRYAVGIHTGEAQVTNIGTEHAPLYTAVGLTVHIATSLQRQTEAGGISCSRVTLVAAGSGIRSAALGPLAIRGLDRGVDAFALHGITP